MFTKTNRNDPLVESIKNVMEQNDLLRRVESAVNEHFGVVSKKALPHEYHAEYDALFEETKKCAMAEEDKSKKTESPEHHRMEAIRAHKAIKISGRLPHLVAKKKEHEEAYRKMTGNKIKYLEDLDEEKKYSPKQKRLARLGNETGHGGNPHEIDKPDLEAARKNLAHKVGLEEQLVYVYENYDEASFSEFVNSLSEEELSILELDNINEADGWQPPSKASVAVRDAVSFNKRHSDSGRAERRNYTQDVKTLNRQGMEDNPMSPSSSRSDLQRNATPQSGGSITQSSQGGSYKSKAQSSGGSTTTGAAAPGGSITQRSQGRSMAQSSGGSTTTGAAAPGGSIPANAGRGRMDVQGSAGPNATRVSKREGATGKALAASGVSREMRRDQDYVTRTLGAGYKAGSKKANLALAARAKQGPTASGGVMGAGAGGITQSSQKAPTKVRRKTVNESIDTILEEIRNNLEEQLTYVYENYDEATFNEYVASLTEEQLEILGLIEQQLDARQKLGGQAMSSSGSSSSPTPKISPRAGQGPLAPGRDIRPGGTPLSPISRSDRTSVGGQAMSSSSSSSSPTPKISPRAGQGPLAPGRDIRPGGTPLNPTPRSDRTSVGGQAMPTTAPNPGVPQVSGRPAFGGGNTPLKTAGPAATQRPVAQKAAPSTAQKSRPVAKPSGPNRPSGPKAQRSAPRAPVQKRQGGATGNPSRYGPAWGGAMGTMNEETEAPKPIKESFEQFVRRFLKD